MALIPIMGQPVNLVPSNEENTGCDIDSSYCVLYGQEAATDTEPAESIMFEIKQTPCGSNLIIDGDFPDGSAWVVVSGDIVFAGGKATHVVGTSAELNQDITDIDLGTYYQVKVTVTGMSAGTLDIYFTQTGTYSAQITENGIYTFYLSNLGDDDGIDFVWSSDCDAAINGVEVYKLLSDVTAGAYANLVTIDGVFVVGLVADFFEDYVVFNLATNTLTEGCYNIQVIDPCAVDVGLMTEVFTDPSFANAGDWTVSGGGLTAVVSGGRFLCTAGAGTGAGTATQPFNFPVGVRTLYYVEFTTGQIESTNAGGGVYVDGNEFFSASGLLPNTTYSKYGIYSADYFNGSELDQQFFFGIDVAGVAGDVNEILSVSVLTVPLASGTGVFTSNCLKVSADTTGTRVVEGFADLTDESSSPFKGKSLGFLFVDDYFWLKARLGCSFSNPHNTINTANNLFSSGTKRKAFAQIAKAWDLTFHDADFNMHDTISNIINCDQFLIDDIEYITDEKEYTANYGSKGVAPVAESTIEVQRISGTRFNTNV